MNAHSAEKDLVRTLFGAVIRATCPDDPCGHLPNCGYTAEHQTCGCSEWGKRLHDAITACVLTPAEKDPATLTDKEIELREWLRAQPGGGERWMVIKAGFRRSYDMGVNHGWGLGAKHMRAVLTRVLPPGVGA